LPRKGASAGVAGRIRPSGATETSAAASPYATIPPFRIEWPNRKQMMQNLSPRHVKIDESLRLGVVSGWYSTKVSGTFVSGPHESEADCLRRIAEIDPPPARKR